MWRKLFMQQQWQACWPYVLVPLLVWIFYSGLIVSNGHFQLLAPHPRNYFKDLAQAFLHGRLNIACPAQSHCIDLVFYNNKYYLYWPPVPAFVYMPLVCIFGLQTPDAFINGLFGTLNVFLLLVFIRRFSKRYQIIVSNKTLALLGLCWGLGTVHFYMSMQGSVWFVSQVMAQTFLLLSLNVFLAAKNYQHYFFSGLYFALACFTRNDLVCVVFFMAALYYTSFRKNLTPFSFKSILFFMALFFVFAALNGWYNCARFGSIFNNGLAYHQMNAHFAENFKTYGFFSWHYIAMNIHREVWQLPPLSHSFPFLATTPKALAF